MIWGGPVIGSRLPSPCIPIKFNFEAGSNCEAPRKLESDYGFHLQYHTRQADFLWFLQFRVIQGSTRGVPYMYPQEETWGNPLPKFGDQATSRHHPRLCLLRKHAPRRTQIGAQIVRVSIFDRKFIIKCPVVVSMGWYGMGSD